VIAQAKRPSRPFDVYDVFGLPLSSNAVRLVQGRFEETLHPQEAVALAHLDCDWHESVLVCLERISPMLVPGGTLVVDDYDAWAGARTAVDPFLSTRGDEFDVRRGARLHLVRRG
jgi:Macrocin-O-methyltransferase (TylF)